MTLPRQILRLLAALVVCLVLSACLGKKLDYDAERLQRKCEVSAETEVTLDQARCIAKVAGLKESRKCPFSIDDSGSVYAVRESCSTIGIRIDKASGEIVGVEVGQGAARTRSE